MKLTQIIQQAGRITPPQVSATNIMKREKFVNHQADQKCTYIENVPHYHVFYVLQRKLF